MSEREIERWVTIRGHKVPIYKGETEEDVHKRFSDFVDSKKQSSISNKDVQDIAKLNHVELKINDDIDNEILVSNIQALRDVADEFPEVEKIMTKKGQKLSLTIEAFKASNVIGEHNNDSASGDTAPLTNIISLNTKAKEYSGDLDQCAETMLRYGTKRKFGQILSSSNINHNIVHEFGHVMQNVLAIKAGDSVTEMREEAIQIASSKSGVVKIPTNISSYANKNHSELISECIADAYFNGMNANTFSIEVYNYFKRQLGGKKK